MNENQEIKISMAAKWLQYLIIICIVSMALSLASAFSFLPTALITWTNRVIIAAITVCTYKLSQWNARYKKAAVFSALMLVGQLITGLLAQSAMLTLAASICSLISVYQEYCAHAELIEAKDQKLANQWRSLFLWSLVAGVLVFIGATVMVLVMAAATQEANAAGITATLLVILSVLQIVVHAVYIRYLRKMIAYLLHDSGAE